MFKTQTFSEWREKILQNKIWCPLSHTHTHTVPSTSGWCHRSQRETVVLLSSLLIYWFYNSIWRWPWRPRPSCLDWSCSCTWASTCTGCFYLRRLECVVNLLLFKCLILVFCLLALCIRNSAVDVWKVDILVAPGITRPGTCVRRALKPVCKVRTMFL